MRKENPQQEDVEEASQAQGMTNLKVNTIIVRILAIRLHVVGFPRIKSRRRPTMRKKRMRSLKRRCYSLDVMEVAKRVHGTLAMVQETISGDVSFDDDYKILVKGKCNILIPLKDRRHEFISNVYYVLNMNKILNICQLLEKGYCINLKDLSLSIKYGRNNLITKVPMLRKYGVLVEHPK